MRRAPAKSREQLKNAALLAIDDRIAAQILLRFYQDLALRGQAERQWRCTTRSTCGAGTNSSRHCAGGATRVRTYRTVSLMVFPAATHWAYQGTGRTRPLGDGHAPCVKVLTGTPGQVGFHSCLPAFPGTHTA